MRTEVKEFIENNIDEINRENFKPLYDRLSAMAFADFLNRSMVSNFTETLLGANIRPLEYLTYVPDFYLYRTSIPFKYLELDTPLHHVGTLAFAFIDSLEEVTLNVLNVNVSAFLYCKSLKEVTLKETTVIDAQAFSLCEKLEKVRLPATLKKIQHAAFKSDTSLKEIVFEGTQSQWKRIMKDGWRDINPSPITIHCSDGSVIDI